MPIITQQAGNLILTIPKSMVSERFVQRLVEWLEYAALSQQMAMSQEEADALAQEIKQQGWEQAGAQLLRKIGKP